MGTPGAACLRRAVRAARSQGPEGGREAAARPVPQGEGWLGLLETVQSGVSPGLGGLDRLQPLPPPSENYCFSTTSFCLSSRVVSSYNNTFHQHKSWIPTNFQNHFHFFRCGN